MQRSVQKSNAPTRPGFSLLELVVVLGIVAMISAMAAPQIVSMLREGAVFTAADDLREALGTTRRYAIDTGIDYEFRYELNGPTAVVLPSEMEKNENETGQSTTTEKYIRMLLPLPDDMHIQADEGVDEKAETLDPERFGSLGGAQLARKQWSAPVMFRFDGTADDFVFRVSNDEGLTSKITLRGLTGTSRMSQVYPEEK